MSKLFNSVSELVRYVTDHLDITTISVKSGIGESTLRAWRRGRHEPWSIEKLRAMVATLDDSRLEVWVGSWEGEIAIVRGIRRSLSPERQRAIGRGRKTDELSRAEFAMRIGCSPSSVAAWEQGRPMSLQALRIVANSVGDIVNFRIVPLYNIKKNEN